MRGWASKAGIVGCSYGGYVVTQSLARHPTTYDAGHTMCTIVDAITEWSRGGATDMAFFQGLPQQAGLAEYATVPARLLTFRDAPHGFGAIPPHELYDAQEQLIWFRTYLMEK